MGSFPIDRLPLVAIAALLICGCAERAIAPAPSDRVNAPPLGAVELPADGAIQSPLFKLAGWAGDDRGVRAVRVFVDGTLSTIAQFVVDRPDVTQVFPHLRHGTERFGWEATVDVNEPRSYSIRVEVVDTDGATTDLGTRRITVAGR